MTVFGDVGGESRTLDYAYDLLGRLTTVTAGGDVVEAYRYDANGNRTHTTVPARGVDATMTFDTADRIATSAEATYTTDTDGFVTSKETSAGTTTYRYSAPGELEEVTLPSGRTITYVYDAFSRRVSRSVDGALTERYLWADATHLLAVYPAQGSTPTFRFTYADGRVPTSVQTSDGATFRLITDQVGTVRALVASDGTITNRVERDSYGAITSGTADFPLGFAGGLADADTGLTHFGAREYDPALGRWLSRDPIDFAGGDANLYGYVLGDPVRWTDPSGLYIGEFPPVPPGYSSSWTYGYYETDAGITHYLQDPEGSRWLAHREDEGHWRHWDRWDKGDNQRRFPPDSKKPWPGQERKLKPDQSACDPNGDTSAWQPPFRASLYLRSTPTVNVPWFPGPGLSWPTLPVFNWSPLPSLVPVL